jgi:RimJ/RimL family protein N-acetyltransferase
MREVREKDLDRLLEIINEPKVVRYMPLEKPVTIERVRKWYDSSLLNHALSIFVLELERPIGALSIRKDGKTTIWIKTDHQRKGHGTVAMEWAAVYAKEKGLTRLWLECFKENRQALSFYHKLGYKDIGERGNNTIMELKL